MSLFVLVYGACNHYASTVPKEELYGLFLSFEQNIPFVPWSILIYRTLDLLLILVVFTVNYEYLWPYFKTMIATLFLAAIVFYLIPTQLGFPWPKEVNDFKLLFDILYSLDKPHNLVPSLHITYTFITLYAMNRSCGNIKWFQCISCIWFILMSLSVILTHQHHLFDILAGVVLGFIGVKIFHYFLSKLKT